MYANFDWRAEVNSATRLDSRVEVDEAVYTLRIPKRDLTRVSLAVADEALIAECDGAEATVADRLLALELLVRRIEES